MPIDNTPKTFEHTKNLMVWTASIYTLGDLESLCPIDEVGNWDITQFDLLDELDVGVVLEINTEDDRAARLAPQIGWFLQAVRTEVPEWLAIYNPLENLATVIHSNLDETEIEEQDLLSQVNQ